MHVETGGSSGANCGCSEGNLVGLETEGQSACPCPGNLSGKFLAASLLLCLSRESTHGYQLPDELAQLKLFGSPPDATSVYRTLRRLEQDGLVVSRWVPGEAGPARRLYDLNADGREFLQAWAGSIRQDRQVIDRFLNLYAQDAKPRRAHREAATKKEE